MEKRLRIAIQKSGRLNENSIKILKEAGIEFDNGLNKLKAEAFNAKIKAVRAAFRGVKDVRFFLFRLANIYA